MILIATEVFKNETKLLKYEHFVATESYLTEDKVVYLLTMTKPRVLELNLAKRVGSSMSRPCSLMKP